ncbi:nucleotidyltransferase family protein [Magnetospirillum sp. UT-4]|uniref:nucleotidyltransferase family protein n=1 Tax=Magnetospirillum sp. UT-4 TaxID=2681467 RepID=UPI00137ED0C3|nr:nucleotidyltransferase domain-containing protein [Magnetospirillum sp. UT-4]CAA7620750.1 DNA polymerase, beta domain protein region [Magnetospirillum sp. UT-4]
MARLDDILAILRAHQDELKARGVLHAGVFGSVARGEETEDSDVDVALDLDPGRSIGLFAYSGIRIYLADVLGREVDIVSRPCRRPDFAAEVERDYRNAF